MGKTTLKSAKDIEKMQFAGKILHNAIHEATSHIAIGMTTHELDQIVEKYILKNGGEPGFKKVPGYNWATCICVNDEVVHTPPSQRILEDGDVVTIDAGVYYNGMHTDSATTVQIGTKTPEVTLFLETGKKALKKALKEAQNGKNIGDISKVFHNTIEGAGYHVIPELTGHGIGSELHEDPYVPCYLDRAVRLTPRITKGMTLAIEVMYTTGSPELEYDEDNGWTIRIKDGSISATFEHTVAVLENKTLILT